MASKRILRGAALAALSLALGGHAAAQDTASGIRGVVTNQSGATVPGAQITIRHTPSGATRTATTNQTGGFFALGLRIGGPYTVTITAPGLETSEVGNIYLRAGEIEPFRATLSESMDQGVVIIGVRNRLSLNNGAGSSFSGADILNAPSFNRDLVGTLLRDPLTSNPGGAQGNITVAGINPRLNGLSIDGVLTQDDFGLGASTYPTNRSPIALDTVAAASIVASDFSVTSTGFQGGLINVVTKSGGNEFHGSL